MEMPTSGQNGAQVSTERSAAADEQASAFNRELRTLEGRYELPELSQRTPWWRRRHARICAAAFAVVMLALVLPGLLWGISQRARVSTASTIAKIAFASCTQRWNGPNTVWQSVCISASVCTGADHGHGDASLLLMTVGAFLSCMCSAKVATSLWHDSECARHATQGVIPSQPDAWVRSDPG